MALRRKIAVSAVAIVFIACVLAAGGVVLDRWYPPPLPDDRMLSVEVTDREGQLLRVFAAGDGRWRLKTALDDIDPEFIALLIAYEDKRFHSHHGVDPLAMMRALKQLLANGRIVSGGSTITMQLARLLEPRPSRTIGAKILQMARAVQLERRFSKAEILEWYLSLAPYGGNLEGVRAASLAYFGKEPFSLTLQQASLLVALPQSPETRRPDRHAKAAQAASLRVLGRAAEKELIDPGEIDRVAGLEFSVDRRSLPAHAAHLAQRARAAAPDQKLHATTLLKAAQAELETVAREAAERLGRRLSVAIVMADARNGSIVAQVGSAGYFDSRRAGWIDMSLAARSPGSTLKPFIYGLAFEEGLVMPETLIADRPANFFRIPSAQFRHAVPGGCQRPAGAANVAERPGRQVAGRRRPSAPGLAAEAWRHAVPLAGER